MRQRKAHEAALEKVRPPEIVGEAPAADDSVDTNARIPHKDARWITEIRISIVDTPRSELGRLARPDITRLGADTIQCMQDSTTVRRSPLCSLNCLVHAGWVLGGVGGSRRCREVTRQERRGEHGRVSAR